jgi:coatomer protein complex subunit gamma
LFLFFFCFFFSDISMLGQGARLIKQSIVDQHAYVASAAIVSGYHLLSAGSAGNYDVVKRWSTEISDALNSPSPMVQYHALGLLAKLREADRLAMSQLVAKVTRSPLRSSWAHVLLVKLTAQVIAEDSGSVDVTSLFEYLESCLRHKSEIVIFEAARAICSLPRVSSRELSPAVNVLQLFLSSPKATLRFAAVRTLNKVAQTHPLAVTSCNTEMDNLVTDSNRSIATLAITTLLKTGSESSVDRLMKQISTFLGEISDEFKQVVVEALQGLCLKFPQKQAVLMAFLDTMLRDEGGFAYKKAIVDAMVTIINQLPETKEKGLSYLCEFIEDCDFPYLSSQVLFLLGQEGPKAQNPGKYIRYIYNRLILENSSVRAAAASSLIKFAQALPETLGPSIAVLLKRCVHDHDDEVRDRATLYLGLLTTQGVPKDVGLHVLSGEIGRPLDNLETALRSYLAEGSAAKGPFSLEGVSTVSQKSPSEKAAAAAEAAQAAKGKPLQEVYEAEMAQVPELAKLGKLWKSTTVDAVDRETEYVVTQVKHVFEKHVVFQFNITSTMADQFLKNVRVALDAESGSVEDLVFDFTISCNEVKYAVPAVCYSVYKRAGAGHIPSGTMNATLKFNVVDADPQTHEPEDETDEGYEDEYELEDVEVEIRDYMLKVYCPNFQEQWESASDENEAKEVFNLAKFDNLPAAVKSLLRDLGMEACDKSDRVGAKKSKHALYASGVFLGGVPTLARCRMKKQEGGKGVDVEL